MLRKAFNSYANFVGLCGGGELACPVDETAFCYYFVVDIIIY